MNARNPPAASRARLVTLTVLLTSLFWTVVWGGYALLRGRPQPVEFQVQPPPATWTPAPSATPPQAGEAGSLAPGDAAQTGSPDRATQPAQRGGAALDAAADDMPRGGAAEAAPATPPTPSGATGDLVNINTATAAELEELPGIGPAIAAAIIAHRQKNGSFASVDALDDVQGIGPATLEAVRALVTVE
jgi:competence protein ComEA